MDDINTILDKWQTGISGMSPVLIAIALGILVLTITLAVFAYLSQHTQR